jgi:acyl carrier protein
MNRQEILQEFKTVLLPYTIEKEKLKDIDEQTDLLKDLHINSANIVDIVIDAEVSYAIEIDNDSIDKMVKVGGCIDVIMDKMNTAR